MACEKYAMNQGFEGFICKPFAGAIYSAKEVGTNF